MITKIAKTVPMIAAHVRIIAATDTVTLKRTAQAAPKIVEIVHFCVVTVFVNSCLARLAPTVHRIVNAGELPVAWFYNA